MAQNSISKKFDVAVWKLNGRKAEVQPHDGGTFKVVVRWSEKLGVSLDHVFTDEANAKRIAEDVSKQGAIKTQYWSKEFFPKWGVAPSFISAEDKAVYEEIADRNDKALAQHLFTARNLLRPSVQVLTPTIVTPASFATLKAFVQRCLHALGYGAPPDLPAGVDLLQVAEPMPRA